MKNYIKVFLWTSIISTTLFYIVGNIFFKGLIDYGDWTMVFFPIHFVLTFIVMTPLLLPFWYLEKKQLMRKNSATIYSVGLRTLIGTIYIVGLLWFAIFSDSKQRLKDPYNYFEDLKYLGRFSLITIVIFAITYYYNSNRKLPR